MSSPAFDFSQLSDDVVFIIFTCLSPLDVLRLAAVSRSCHAQSQREDICREFFSERWKLSLPYSHLSSWVINPPSNRLFSRNALHQAHPSDPGETEDVDDHPVNSGLHCGVAQVARLAGAWINPFKVQTPPRLQCLTVNAVYCRFLNNTLHQI